MELKDLHLPPAAPNIRLIRCSRRENLDHCKKNVETFVRVLWEWVWSGKGVGSNLLDGEGRVWVSDLLDEGAQGEHDVQCTFANFSMRRNRLTPVLRPIQCPTYENNTTATHGSDRTTHSTSSPLQCYMVFMRPNDP